jgi:FAD/FMN-containing dehydrogenase
MTLVHQASTTSVLGAASLADLRAGLHGGLLRPGDASYESARKLWNGMVDRYPAVIVCCADSADVIRAVQFARSNGLRVAVRGGGHNVSGNASCDGGIVIDLSQMKRIQVDPITRTARAEPGLTLGEFIRATEVVGLLTTTGTVSDTGMAGLTLGGGLGWLMGLYGLTVDNLLSVEIVTADGQLRHASENEHSDLFWAVRGGGGNFGIVTSFTYRLHPVSPILAGMVVHPLSRVREVLRFYRDFSSAAPDALTAYAALVTTPDGLPAVAITLCYAGPPEVGEQLIAPVRSFGPPLADLIRPMSYYEVITMLDAAVPAGRNYYEKGSVVPTLSDAAIEVIAEYGARCPSPFAQVLFQHVHGAAARIDPAATAVYALRRTHYSVSIISAWDRGDSGPHVTWARDFWAALEPYATGGVYVNALGNEGNARVRAAYGPNYERLVTIKNTYDPTNFFQLNQNIKPIRMD